MQIKPILLAALIFFGVLFIMLIPSKGINKFYSNIYKGIGNAVYPLFIDKSKRIIQCELEDFKDDTYRIKVKIGNLEYRSQNGKILARVLRINSRTFAYIPIVFLIALILATPVSIRRRLAALFYGFVIYNVFIVLKMLAFVFQSSQEEFAVADFPGWIQTLIDTFTNVFILNTEMGTSLALSVLIWIIVTIRIQDINRLKKVFMQR